MHTAVQDNWEVRPCALVQGGLGTVMQMYGLDFIQLHKIGQDYFIQLPKIAHHKNYCTLTKRSVRPAQLCMHWISYIIVQNYLRLHTVVQDK